MSHDKSSLRIVFFGTPDFAVASLKAIVNAGYQVVAVVTAPDKAAGRGYQIKSPAVKTAALELGLPVMQPEKLKAPEFVEALRELKADLQIVIAFRMLPEIVWNMPPLGTFNLHASYLPAYRGAAPINRAIMNGETQTGVTTFFLRHEIDTGQIILQGKTDITPDDNAGSLHDKLMLQGAELVVKSLDVICSDQLELKPQAEGKFPNAPKIFTEDCCIDPSQPAIVVHNQVRGLSPYPAAYSEFNGKKIKIYKTEITSIPASVSGTFEHQGKNLYLNTADFKLRLIEIQPEGKKRMGAADFINGLNSGTH